MGLPLLVGLRSGIGVVLLAHVLKFDRDRSFYPTVLIASYYVLFDMMAEGHIWTEVVR